MNMIQASGLGKRYAPNRSAVTWPLTVPSQDPKDRSGPGDALAAGGSATLPANRFAGRLRGAVPRPGRHQESHSDSSPPSRPSCSPSSAEPPASVQEVFGGAVLLLLRDA